jgi:phytanoyl-CoA hydroxylase
MYTQSEGTATKVHFDQCFLRGAPATSLTAWVPIGDIPPESGGLLYLENSVPLGQAFEEEFTKNNASLSDAERLSAFNVNMMDRGNLSRDAGEFAREKGQGRRWLVADYEAGDVVFHHPCMIHASGVNRDPKGRIRLATDLRFADRAAPYDERWAYKYFEPGDGL